MRYGVGVKGYVWCVELKRMITSRDVIFDEKNMLVSSVERLLYNDVVIPIYAQLKNRPPENK